MRSLFIWLVCGCWGLLSNLEKALAYDTQALHLPVAELMLQLAEEAHIDVLVSADVDAHVHTQWQGVSPQVGLQQLCLLAILRCRWSAADRLLVVPVEGAGEVVLAAHVLPIKYAKPSILVTKLSADMAAFGGRLVADDEGQLLIAWLPKGVEHQLTALVEALDKPVPQVQIDARVIIASRDAGASLRRGLRVNASTADLGSQSQLSIVSEPQSQSAGYLVGMMAPHILLNLELAAMEATGQVMTLAQPQVVVQHLAEGRIETGQEVPYVIVGEHGQTRQWKEAVLGLRVSPRVLAHGQVELDLAVVQDSVGELLANGELALNTHRLHTQVRMAFNDTLVLGGALYEQQLQGLVENPVWMAMPFMQRWWQSAQQQSQEFELLVFVTPRELTDLSVNK